MTLLRTSAAAHDIAQQIVCDFKPQSTTKPSEERRKANTLKVTKIKKDDRDLKKVLFTHPHDEECLLFYFTSLCISSFICFCF